MPSAAASSRSGSRDAVQVSAETGEGLDALREAVEARFLATLRPMELLVPYEEGGRLSELHDLAGEMEREETAGGREGARPRPRVGGGTLRAFRAQRRGAQRLRAVTLRFARLSEDAAAPERAHDDDAGYDLRAAEACSWGRGSGRASGPGSPSPSHPARRASCCLARALRCKHGIALVNAPGLIDSGYRGEVRVLLLNTDRSSSFEVAVGDRIAQLVVVRHEDTGLEEVESLDETVRGTAGFGSTGRD